MKWSKFIVKVLLLFSQEEVTPYKMYMLKVEGSGFLWHMIRCIVGVLFEVGMGKEEPEVT